MERPRLKVSYKDKIAEDFQYCKDWIDFAADNARRDDLKELDVLYKLAKNQIDEAWFNHVTNPFNASRPENKRFPAKIEMYNLLYSNFTLLLGEKVNRPFSFTVMNNGSDVVSRKEQKRYETILENLKQHFVNTVNEVGGDVGMESREVPLPEEVEALFNSNYRDEIAASGQNILEYILQNARAKEVFIDCFKDWLTCGEAYTKSYVKDDEVYIERIHPALITYGSHRFDHQATFVEDADWVCVRYRWSPSQILDHFYDLLTEEQVEELSENSTYGYSPFYRVFRDFYDESETQHNHRNYLFVEHVQWKCFAKKKLLEWEGDFGPESLIVDEDYKLTDLDNEKEAELSTFWVPEVWEGWRIDNRIYLGIRPLPEQRNSVTDPAQCKLSYNGFRSKPSFLKLGLVWQKLYIILWYRLEKALANSKGTLAVLPLQAIPNGQGKEGWDKETFLYTSEALGMILLDLEADGMEGRTLNNMVAKIDMNQYQDIKFFIELLEYVKTTWDELVGINKQRKGQISASQGLGTNEQSIAQSTAVTEIFYYEFEKLESRDIGRMLDYSKFAYKNGKVSAFLRDDLTEEFIDVDPEVHLYAQYGVHVVKSAIENQKLQQLKQAGVNLASQGNRPSVIAEILDASSFAQAKRVLSALEAKEMKMAQEQSQSEQEAQQKMQQLQQEFEAYKQQLDTQGQIAVDDNRIAKETEKELTILAAQPQEETVAPTDNSGIEREKLQSAERQNDSKVGMENKKIAADVYTKELDAATKLAVAKENKNKHDTKK